MTNGFIIQLIIQIIVGGVAVFLGILLWSRSRDPAWMFMIAASISFYAGIFYRILRSTGIIVPIKLGEILIIDTIFEILPLLFIIIAFIVVLVREK